MGTNGEIEAAHNKKDNTIVIGDDSNRGVAYDEYGVHGDTDVISRVPAYLLLWEHHQHVVAEQHENIPANLLATCRLLQR